MTLAEAIRALRNCLASVRNAVARWASGRDQASDSIREDLLERLRAEKARVGPDSWSYEKIQKLTAALDDKP